MFPLQDHFHPPLSVRRHWHAFHNAWATYLASDLNTRLPKGYFAEPNVQFGIEIDVAAFEEVDRNPIAPVIPWSAIAPPWIPPEPSLNIPFLPLQERAEVEIFGTEGGPGLVGAIELVSPANKDRISQRQAFVAKCETYLRQGIGLVIVDVVTTRKANLHQALLERLAEGHPPIRPMDSDLYATAYRPIERGGQVDLDVWQETLAVDGLLPTLPLWLPGDICLPVDLARTYERTCREQRIVSAG
ncbi:MAG: DUF4058 family protein [Oculatellaceae cyanobacterium Prado106]|jgi:hypothetical protein|nr:DUF4058 family protein [Oculatellaceae cyanobacterium Prado106]